MWRVDRVEKREEPISHYKTKSHVKKKALLCLNTNLIKSYQSLAVPRDNNLCVKSKQDVQDKNKKKTRVFLEFLYRCIIQTP